MEINVTHRIELSQDTKDFLTNLFNGWTQLSNQEKIETYDLTEKPNIQQAIDVVDAVREEAQKQAPVVEEVSLDELKKLALAFSQKYGSDQMKQYLLDNGFERISEIDESKISEFYAQLKAEYDGN